MSESGDFSSAEVKKMPRFILHKDKLKNVTVIKPGNNVELIRTLKTYSRPLYKEDTIYQSVPGDFLRLTDEKLTLVNRLNLLTQSCLTVARYERPGYVTVEKTSENLTNLIGKDNFDLLFSTLCSVINQEFKIRSILALLTVPKKTESCQVSETFSKGDRSKVDVSIQTNESSFDMMMRAKPRRRVKRQFPAPYVVTDKPALTKVVINPSEFKNFTVNNYPLKFEKKDTPPSVTTESSHLSNIEIISVKTEISQSSVTDSNSLSCPDMDSDLPNLHIHMDEDSKDSMGGLSEISFKTSPELIKDPYSLLKNIDKVTESVPPVISNVTSIQLLDGTVIPLPVKVEDEFHIATPEILEHVPREHWRKLLLYQLYMDWKHCLRRDENGHLAIHTAALNDDVDLVRRQCLVLKGREESVDILTDDNMSALQLSILGGRDRCTGLLLQHGASPLLADEEYRSCLHLAAEAGPAQLRALLRHCRAHPAEVLQQCEELWKPELALKPKEYQASYLLDGICSMCDNPGYTPLMLAAKSGLAENVRLLLEAAPCTVNAAMPTGGNTALHLAVESACHDAANRGNKSKIMDNFKETIEILIENGADPSRHNSWDVDVNTLLTDFNNGELSRLIACKMTYLNTKNSATSTFQPGMLIKKEDGTFNTEEVNDSKGKKGANGKGKDKDKGKMKAQKTVKEVKSTGKNIKAGQINKNTVQHNKGIVQHSTNTVQHSVNTVEHNKITEQHSKNTTGIMIKTDSRNEIEHMEITDQTNIVGHINTDKQMNICTVKKASSNAPKGTEGKKVIILKDKVIKNTNTSPISDSKQNKYLSSYENFVKTFDRTKQSKNEPVLIAPTIKRKSDISTPSLDSNPVMDHPRVKILRKTTTSKLNPVVLTDPLNVASSIPSSSKGNDGVISPSPKGNERVILPSKGNEIVIYDSSDSKDGVICSIEKQQSI